jgi:MFS family permease
VPIDPCAGRPDGFAFDGAELDPAAGVAADVVAVWVDEVLGLAGPPVDARATLATPPPSPAATTAVMTSRRTRPGLLDLIRLLQGATPRSRGRRRTSNGLRSVPNSLGARPAQQPSPCSQRTLSCIALAPSVWFAALATGVAGLCTGPMAVISTVLTQAATPDELRGRVSSFTTMTTYGAVLVASSATGLAIGVFGLTGTYAISGAIEAAGLLLLGFPGLRPARIES